MHALAIISMITREQHCGWNHQSPCICKRLVHTIPLFLLSFSLKTLLGYSNVDETRAVSQLSDTYDSSLLISGHRGRANKQKPRKELESHTPVEV